MEDKIKVIIILNSKEINKNHIVKWLDEMFFFKPTTMRGSFSKNKEKKYDSAEFLKYLQQEQFHNRKITIDLKDEDLNSFVLIKGASNPNIAWITFYLNQDIYNKHYREVLEYVDDVMREANGIVARASSLSDDFWQDNEDLDMYRIRDKSLEGVRIKPSPFFENETVVDTEYNPGHSHIVDGIWFGSNWAMWFGQKYFKLIPRKMIANFKECFSNEELEGGVIKILLYKNIWDYDLTKNRERQLLFRKSVGMDTVAHFRQNNNKSQEVTDPSIDLDTGNFPHGGVKRITYYYNCEGDIVPKSKATKEKVFEFDEEGNIVWSNC